MGPRSTSPDPRPTRRGQLALLAGVGLLGLGLFLALAPRSGADEAKPASADVRREPLLPSFSGKGLDGAELDAKRLTGKRGLIVLFASDDADAPALAKTVVDVADAARKANVSILGISRDTDVEKARTFAKKYGLDFPILHDAGFKVSNLLRVPLGSGALLFVDAPGYLIGGFSTKGLSADVIAEYTRTALRLKQPTGRALELAMGMKPAAPAFAVEPFGGGDKVSLDAYKGDVVVVIFFLHTCPHCHRALRFLNRLVQRLDRDDLHVVPISVRDQIYAVEQMAKDQGLDLTLYRDPKGAVGAEYMTGGGVPQFFIVGRDQKIIATHISMDPRVEALVTMEVRRALGIEQQPLLARNAYSGEEFCRACHDQQHATWSLTNHAYAFDTLIEHGQDRNPECVGCHTVGFGQPGGFALDQLQPHLQGVQCENCHGRGGPHQSPEFAKQGYEPVCKGCHNPEHSLHFDFAERLPLISHATNRSFMNLSVEERQALLEKRQRRERTLFDDAEFVGSAACKSCHEKEHALWAESPHADAFETLRTKAEQQNAACQTCHTTGFAKPGGFPDGGAKLAGVGCESCHGPGGNHVAESAPKQGTILRLTEKCDTCAIVQICGSCHDDANDPGFEFEVEKKVDVLRHGFRDREPASGDGGA